MQGRGLGKNLGKLKNGMFLPVSINNLASDQNYHTTHSILLLGILLTVERSTTMQLIGSPYMHGKTVSCAKEQVLSFSKDARISIGGALICNSIMAVALYVPRQHDLDRQVAESLKRLWRKIVEVFSINNNNLIFESWHGTSEKECCLTVVRQSPISLELNIRSTLE